MNAVDLSAAATRVASSLGSGSSHRRGSHTAVNTAAASGKTDSATPNASASTSGQITSSDFLTLLVTEMKNQDPTQPTDPNAYIQQLVSVNSLQQLIAINKELTPTSTAVSGGKTG